MESKNQLFIHPTDACNLNCDFCIYAKSRGGSTICAKIDMSKGYAKENLTELIQGAQHTAFSGGGEPFLNVEAVESCIRLNKKKKYMITTGLGLPLNELEHKITRVNQACIDSDSLCVLRISVDAFHNNLDLKGDVDSVIKWFINKRWERVRTCFIRGTVAEGAILIKNMKRYCLRNWMPFVSKKINKYTYAFIIKKKFFQVLLRPTIYPNQIEREKEESLLEYIDTMLKIDTEEIYLGKPRSCRGCKGCDSWKSDMPNGLDITINAKGDITLYGAEICELGNIYREKISYDLLHERINNTPELVKLQSYGLRKVMEAFEKDSEIGEIVNQINYPFAVIRECMRDHKDAVYRIIRNM